jgi:hypothetical protein
VSGIETIGFACSAAWKLFVKAMLTITLPIYSAKPTSSREKSMLKSNAAST